jgi:single-strand DNA-binding protein
MSKSVNSVTLLGNVGKDPEVKSLPSGQPVANLSLATTYRVKERDSDAWKDMTEWHNVAAYGRTAEILRDYVKKGNRIYLEGRLATRSWDDRESGKKMYKTEIVVGELVLLSGRNDDSSTASAPANGGQQDAGYRGSGARHRSEPDDEYSGLEITDDDIPF